MPYKKPKQSRYIAVTRLLRGYGMNGPKLADVLHCSVSTALKKLNNPELLTVADLYNIVCLGHIPADAVKEALDFR